MTNASESPRANAPERRAADIGHQFGDGARLHFLERARQRLGRGLADGDQDAVAGDTGGLAVLADVFDGDAVVLAGGAGDFDAEDELEASRRPMPRI